MMCLSHLVNKKNTHSGLSSIWQHLSLHKSYRWKNKLSNFLYTFSCNRARRSLKQTCKNRTHAQRHSHQGYVHNSLKPVWQAYVNDAWVSNSYACIMKGKHSVYFHFIVEHLWGRPEGNIFGCQSCGKPAYVHE